MAPGLSRVVRAAGLTGACGRARGVKDPFQGALATSDGGRQWGFRYSGEGRSRWLLFTRGVRLLRQMYPGRQILRRVSDDTRLVVAEPIGDLPGTWNEVPQQARGDREGTPQLLPFSPSSRRRPGDRVWAGRLHAAADRPPDVGTYGPDPGPVAG